MGTSDLLGILDEEATVCSFYPKDGGLRLTQLISKPFNCYSRRTIISPEKYGISLKMAINEYLCDRRPDPLSNIHHAIF
jgi:hypothetical protein